MASNKNFNCIYCGNFLDASNSTNEHIIPNAMGGQITTKNALCRSCNSKTGHAEDAALIKQLHYYINFFDVPRDRGEHSNYYFTDVENGEKYFLPAGQKAEHTPDIRYQDESCTFSLNAKTKEDALELLNKYTKKKEGDIIKMEGKQIPSQRYNATTSSFSLENTLIAKAITKIALSFCSYSEINYEDNWVALKFIRDNPGSFNPVGWAHKEIIQLDNHVVNPMNHGLYLYSKGNGEPLFCVVRFFQAFEFIVLISDKQKRPVKNSYCFNLINAISETHNFNFIADKTAIYEWIKTKTPFIRQSNLDAVKYWLAHQNDIWIDRALQIATQKYCDLIDSGISKVNATDASQKAADGYLEKYGLKFDKITFTETTN